MQTDPAEPMRSVLFIHIPRTAGSSVHTALHPIFFPRWFVIDDPAKLTGLAAEMNDSAGEGIYLGGHFGLEELKTVGIDTSEMVIFCLLRDPIERALSAYAYIKAYPNSYPSLGPSIVDGRSLEDGIEFIANVAPQVISDTQCLQLCGAPDADRAIDVIERAFDFAALSSRLDDLLVRLTARARLTIQPELRVRVNVGARSEGPSESVRALLADLNREDQRLYEYMLRRDGFFENQRDGAPA